MAKLSRAAQLAVALGVAVVIAALVWRHRDTREYGIFDKIFGGIKAAASVVVGGAVSAYNGAVQGGKVGLAAASNGGPAPTLPPTPMPTHSPPPPLGNDVRVTPSELQKFVNRVVSLRPAAKLGCADSKLSTAWCAAGTNYVDLWAGAPRWILLLRPGTTDLFYLLPENRAGCEDALSVKSECAASGVDLWRDRGGNQQWRFRPVPGKPDTFYIESAAQSRGACNRFLSVRADCGDKTVDMWNAPGQNQEWRLELA